MTIRWGIAAPGRIADTVASDLALVPEAELVAVGSRSQVRADAFAQRHGIERAYGSYRELVADPDIDVIYVATPHPMHKPIALAAIKQGKGVLVEKSFTSTPTAARQIVDAARANNVFCMEGLWSRFHPLADTMHDIVNSGTLGELLSVQGDLTAYRHFDPSDRLFAPELGGGAVQDLGVYVLTLAVDFLGVPSEIVARGHRYPTGVDSDAAMLLTYPDNSRFAALTCALNASGPGRMVLTGSRGWAEIGPRFHHASYINVHQTGTVGKTYRAQLEGNGYVYELAEVTRLISEGAIESPRQPLARTLAVQDLMADVLAQIGVQPVDDADTLE